MSASAGTTADGRYQTKPNKQKQTINGPRRFQARHRRIIDFGPAELSFLSLLSLSAAPLRRGPSASQATVPGKYCLENAI